MSPPSSEVPYGALDLMVLKTLETMGAQHGYGIARRIEQMAEGMLALNQGTIYPALLRLEQKGWIESDWGTSENNRRARFYSITRAGRKQLAIEADLWSQDCRDDESNARGVVLNDHTRGDAARGVVLQTTVAGRGARRGTPRASGHARSRASSVAGSRLTRHASPRVAILGE